MLLAAGSLATFALQYACRSVLGEALFNVSISFLGEGCQSASVMIGSTEFTQKRTSAAMEMVENPVSVKRSDGKVHVGVLDLTQGEAYLRLDCRTGVLGGNGLRRLQPI